MAKESVAANVSGQVDRGDFTFEVTDPTLFKTFKMDGGGPGTELYLLRQNYAGDDYESVTMGGRRVVLDDFNRTVTPAEVGIYTLEGIVGGTVLDFWTEDIS